MISCVPVVLVCTASAAAQSEREDDVWTRTGSSASIASLAHLGRNYAMAKCVKQMGI